MLDNKTPASKTHGSESARGWGTASLPTPDKLRALKRGTLGAPLLLMIGCSLLPSTTFKPRGKERVSLWMRGGQTLLVKDGRVYDLGNGDGLVEVVGDNPRALESAKRYRQNNNRATVFGLAAIVCASAAVYTFFEYDRLESRTVSAGAFAVCGPTIGVIGLVRSRNRANLYDAINVYNETGREH